MLWVKNLQVLMAVPEAVPRRSMKVMTFYHPRGAQQHPAPWAAPRSPWARAFPGPRVPGCTGTHCGPQPGLLLPEPYEGSLSLAALPFPSCEDELWGFPSAGPPIASSFAERDDGSGSRGAVVL